MTFLLDTHYMLWALTDTYKLPKKVNELLVDSDNKIVVSAISFWEVSLKYNLGKIELKGALPESLPASCEKMGFDIEPLSADVCSSYHLLEATHHRDPFDRMLIWMAITRRYTFITRDANVRKYTSAGLLVF